jgi:hypothetical protein
VSHRCERHECKYLVAEERAAGLRRFFAPHIEPDPFTRNHGGSYPIASLYFDTPTWRLHREKAEGQRSRFKLRIRTYGNGDADPVFLEIKRRHDAVISKSRCCLPRSLLARVLRSEDVSAEIEPSARNVYAEFARLSVEIGARPVLGVRYQREAFIGVHDTRARVTFDRRMQFRVGDATIQVDGEGWENLGLAQVILELKFTGRCPAWMSAAVARYELHRISYSKYSNSVLAAVRRGALVGTDLREVPA